MHLSVVWPMRVLLRISSIVHSFLGKKWLWAMASNLRSHVEGLPDEVEEQEGEIKRRLPWSTSIVTRKLMLQRISSQLREKVNLLVKTCCSPCQQPMCVAFSEWVPTKINYHSAYLQDDLYTWSRHILSGDRRFRIKGLGVVGYNIWSHLINIDSALC